LREGLRVVGEWEVVIRGWRLEDGPIFFEAAEKVDDGLKGARTDAVGGRLGFVIGWVSG
jgi:hypothetical protein